MRKPKMPMPKVRINQPIKGTPSGNKVGVPAGQLGGTTDLVTPTAGKAEKAGKRGKGAIKEGTKPKGVKC